jgi:hypothetical protein
MARRLIFTGSPFRHQGSDSRALADGDLFRFMAGTTGYDHATMKMPVGLADQVRNASEITSA